MIKAFTFFNFEEFFKIMKTEIYDV